MAFKTGKTLTLSIAGTTSGSCAPVPEPVVIFGTTQQGFGNGTATFSLSLASTVSVTGSVQLSVANNPPSNSPPQLDSSSITVAANGSSTTVNNPTSGPPVGVIPAINLSGSFSLAVDVEEWIDIVFDDQTVNSDVGVYQPIQSCHARVYLATKPGGSIIGSCTFAGVSASHTTTIVSSVEVTPSLATSAHAGGSNTGNTLPSGGVNLSVSWTASPVMSFPGFSNSKTSAASSSSSSVTSSSAVVSASASSSTTDSINGLGHPSQHTVSALAGATATGSMYPAKAYSVAGEIFSVSDGFPTTVPINLSKYSGDPTPTTNASPGFSAAFSQVNWSYTDESIATTVDTVKDLSTGTTVTTNTGGTQTDTASTNQFQGLSASVDTAWCDTNDEFVTYTNAGGAQVKLYNNLIYLMGYQTGGIGLSLTSPFNVDPGNSLTGWTGAALVGAGIGNSGTGSMTRTFTPFFDMSGHRYLRITGAVTTSGSPQNRVVTIGGKTWNVTFPTVSADIFIDLCNPTTGGADTDTTDTIWPDTNPTLVYGADSGTSVSAGPGDGPLWGVTYCTSLALSGFAGSSTESFASLDLVMQTEAFGHFMCQWEPRFDNLIIQGPDWSVPASGGGDTVFTRGVLRGFILVTDGRQSAEYRSYSLLRTEGGASGVTFYGPTNYSIAAMAASINNGIQIDGGPVGSDANYFNYAVKPNGWTATVIAASPDGTNNVNAGFLNSALPATWVCYGVKYSASGFESTVGLNLTSSGSVGCQMLMSSLDFYPGCGDVFGLGGASPAPNTIYIGASKIYRAQSHGILSEKGAGVFPAVSGSTVTLYPGPGEVQPTGAAVGSATSDSPQGVYRTIGEGLDGFNAVTSGGVTTVNDNVGIVTARNGSGAPQSISITVGEAKLSRAAFRLSAAVAAIIRPDNLGHTDGSFHRVSGVYDMSGAPAGIAYWRCDTGAPRTAGDWTIAAVPISADPTDANPSICIDHWGRVWCRWQRTAGVYVAFSDDDGVSWSSPTLAIANGLYPVNRTGHDGSIYIAAYVDDGTGMSTGTIKAQWQYPGDTAPSSPVTLRKWNGSALVNIAVQLGSFMLAPLMAVHGGWMLTVVEVGASATTDYISYDDAAGTFTATEV